MRALGYGTQLGYRYVRSSAQPRSSKPRVARTGKELPWDVELEAGP
jgi:hypothetical protein